MDLYRTLFAIIVAVDVLYLIIIIKFPLKKKDIRKKIIPVLIILTAVFGFLAFAHRGRNSIWDDKGDSNQIVSGNGDDREISQKKDDGIMTVTISKSTVTINGKTFEVTEKDDSGLTDYIKGQNLLGVAVRISESYSVSYVYHYVEDVLVMSGAEILPE